ncbi:hypothetical protein LOSG293_200330 [Secundilactobacillus oryzae JCM 18671]|uniref:Chemotaxis protein n=1 Tax=Secundilactobacillus oryzae JCM 18671 TaxID=1291743 RepID=A0A081BJE9_9LACO|nr:hypothetical protein [Secundilactobacillus oryzae]GAK48167.1 hypothetical protein LOSG293_200330 [Secundilactobacillus oryzae JCM 18671]
MKPTAMSAYFPVLSDVLTKTDDMGEQMSEDFTTLKTAVDADNVSDLGNEKLVAIRDNFQRGTDFYAENVNKLEQASVPVRILGKHKQLVAAYRNYAEACQAMVDAIDVQNLAVNATAFNESEKTQEHMMEKISNVAQKIMATAM